MTAGVPITQFLRLELSRELTIRGLLFRPVYIHCLFIFIPFLVLVSYPCISTGEEGASNTQSLNR